MIAMAATTAAARVYSGARHFFTQSVIMPYWSSGARIMRWTLTAREQAAPMNFCVTLKMRNFAELQARLGRGEKIPPEDLAANYLPSASDYAAVRDWLVNQGFTLTQQDPNHTAVFAQGTVAQIQNSLYATFAKVGTADGEFTSAITAPSLPVELSAAVLGIDGLQPHIRMHRRTIIVRRPQVNISGVPYLAPKDILTDYNAPTALTGTGQTIAIIMDATVSNADLQSFYAAVGSTQTASNVTTILVNGGPTAADQSNDGDEAALDVEWASGMAPGAKVRLYATSDLGTTSLLTALAMIISDAPVNNITVLSMSFGAPETPIGSLNSLSQKFAQMAAANITVLCSSGDGGSNPDPQTGVYDGLSTDLAPEYPPSDPNVTGVGGTLLTVTSSTASYVSETVFSSISSSNPSNRFASGGGISQDFSIPSWQTDGGPVLSSNTMRCVPDISIIWAAVTNGSPVRSEFALVVANGVDEGGGGTSLSSQVWAGIVALLNQARANAGMGPIGPLGPAIYPLHGTSAFNDITTGNNGAYFAGTGYDLCTGLGSPNIANLAAALTTSSTNQPSGGGGGSGSSSSSSTTVSAAAASSSGGGGGGGGAPSLWFYGALALVAAVRLTLPKQKVS
ncbi:MAG TPA: S53 family peptidase [Opitutaceae bacterium]|nr:S53 family peptidase [Opitutaceae bacterium]